MRLLYMNFISPNMAPQYNVESKIKIQNIQVIQKKSYTKLYKKSKLDNYVLIKDLSMW